MEYNKHIRRLLIKDKAAILKCNKNKAAIALVEILQEDLDNFDYYNPNKEIYLLDIFDLLTKLLANNINIQNYLYDDFTYIHNTLKNLLHAKPQALPEKFIHNYQLLQNIILKMENAMLFIYYYDSPAEFDPNKNEFIYYLIFSLKNINFVENACHKFPHIVNCQDRKGIPLVEKVLDKYLESLKNYLSKPNLGPIDDLIYYDKVMHLLMKNEKVHIDEFSKVLLLNKVKDFSQKQILLTNRHKEKLSFFINNILNTITDGDEDLSIDFLSYKYEIHNKFKEAHNLEAKTIYLANKQLEGEPINKKIYTFDGENALEIDDALSITLIDGIYHLGVHIAYPGAYINPDSILVDEAFRRTTSIYIDNSCIPMFPLKLSGNLMSLNKGKKTYCISYYFDIDERTGNLIDFQIKKEICEITNNLTYNYFNSAMIHGCNDHHLETAIINLNNISPILKSIYNEDETYHQVNNNDDLTLSEQIIANAMIYTNHHIAAYFNERELPFLYRSHKINQKDIKRLSKLQERLSEKNNTNKIIQDIEMIKNIFPKAFYSAKNYGHFGLGVDPYCHATSPLRRLSDNIVNMCIETFIFNDYSKDEIKKMEEVITEAAEAINSKRSAIEDYEIRYAKRKVNR